MLPSPLRLFFIWFNLLIVAFLSAVCAQGAYSYSDYEPRRLEKETPPLVRLTTLWNAPGYFAGHSADGRYLIMRDGDISRLIDIFDDEVVYKVNGRIEFSPQGKFLLVSDYVNELVQLIDFPTKRLIYQATSSFKLNADETLAMTDFRNREYDDVTEVIDTRTGEVVVRAAGQPSKFSPDSAYFSVLEPFVEPPETRIIEMASGQTVFTLAATRKLVATDAGWSMNTAFSPDGSVFAFYVGYTGTTQIVDLASKEVRYEVKGWVRFRNDGRYLVANNDDGYSDVQLIEVSTGEVLNEVMGGGMLFTGDGSLFVRWQGRDSDTVTQIVDIETQDILLELKGWLGVSVTEDGQTAIARDNQTKTTRYISLATGEIIREADRIFFEDVPNSPFCVEYYVDGGTRLAHTETEETLVLAQSISFSPNYIYASNGLLVDVYGAGFQRLETMSLPRAGDGVAQVSTGKLDVYSRPDAFSDHIVEELLPLYVLGKTADHHWLYVVYLSGTGRSQGWVQDRNLRVLVPWDDAPILDPDDPLGSLKATTNG